MSRASTAPRHNAKSWLIVRAKNDDWDVQAGSSAAPARIRMRSASPDRPTEIRAGAALDPAWITSRPSTLSDKTGSQLVIKSAASCELRPRFAAIEYNATKAWVLRMADAEEGRPCFYREILESRDSRLIVRMERWLGIERSGQQAIIDSCPTDYRRDYFPRSCRCSLHLSAVVA
jgi:hypothetical protein